MNEQHINITEKHNLIITRILTDRNNNADLIIRNRAGKNLGFLEKVFRF